MINGHHLLQVLDVSFDSSGSKFVSASADGTARVYNSMTGVCTHTLIGHEGEISKVSFNPQGTRVLTASSDKTCRQDTVCLIREPKLSSAPLPAHKHAMPAGCGMLTAGSVCKRLRGTLTRSSAAPSTTRVTSSSRGARTTLAEFGRP